MSIDPLDRIRRRALLRQQQAGAEAPPTVATEPQPSLPRRALNIAFTPFRIYHEAVLEPLASVAAAPIVPDLKPLPGESFFERKRREYQQWEAPRFAKGGIEFAVDPLNILLPGVGGTLRKGLTTGLRKAAKEAAKETVPLSAAKVKTAAAIRAGIKIRPIAKAQIKAERGLRFREAQEVLEQAPEIGGAEALKRSKTALAGRIEREGIDRLNLTKIEEDDLLKEVLTNFETNLSTAERIKAGDVLTRMTVGEAPRNFTVKELQNLSRALGIKVDRAIGQSAWDNILGLLNLPRAMLASFDISFPLRQGVLLIGHPVQFAKMWKPMIKAFASEKAAVASGDVIRASKHYQKFKDLGLDFVERGGPLAARQEEFMTAFAGKIPGLKHSERAFITAGNELRWKTAFKIADDWEAAIAGGANIPVSQYETLANFLNLATGRGNLGGLQKMAPVINAAFFSPRLLVSRFQAPAAILQGGAVEGVKFLTPVRKIIAKDLATFVGTGLSVLGLLKMAGAEVELDPRSSDYGKYRIGATRGDFWGGYQQIARYASQLMVGQRKTAGAGKIIGIDRADTVLRFLRSKLSPIAGLAIDIAKGETFLGEELTAETEFLGSQVFTRMVPLFIQDMTEAIDNQGALGGFLALPGAAGVGVITYTNLRDIQDAVAQKVFRSTYSELNRGQRREVDDTSEVKAAIDEMEARAGGIDIRTQVQNANEFHEGRKAELETELRSRIEAGAEGPALKDAIQEYKTARRNSGETVFTDEIVASFDPGLAVPIEDVLADMYWSVPLQQDKVTGQLDFRTQGQQREEILRDADVKGVPRNYIIGRGEGTYRGKRFHDATVRQAIEGYEADMETLRPYFGIRDQVFDMIGNTYGQKGLDIWNRYQREEALGHADITKRMRLQYPFISKANSLIRRMKLQMRTQNPEIDALVMRWYGAATIGR